MATKQDLRRELIARRNQLDHRELRSAAICERVRAMPAFRQARAIHSYLPIRSEVDTRPLLDAALTLGKALALPVIAADKRMRHAWISSIDPADFTPGVLGTLYPRRFTPARPGDWDVTIVPMLGFDRAGYRLGYGKGHYDRLLASAPTIAVGVAFAAQELPALPHQPHDRRLDYIATEDELLVLG
jgi:5-formyltetrahydrofolate cyclo-ligase